MKPLFAVTVAVCLGTCQAWADDDTTRPAQSFNPDTFSSLSRLRDPVIRRMLGLTHDQMRNIDAVQAKWSDDFAAFSRLPEEHQERAKLNDLCDQYADAAEKCLTDEQREHLLRLTTATYFGLPIFLQMRDERLQKELQLDEEQMKSVETAYEQWLFEAATILTRPENRRVPRGRQLMNLQPFNEVWHAKALETFRELLSEAQRRRFAEIELQFACQLEGPRVFLDARVAEELQLTHEQVRDVDQIVRKLPTPSRDVQADLEAYRSCLKLLTEAQAERWKRCLVGLIFTGRGCFPRSSRPVPHESCAPSLRPTASGGVP